MCGLPIFELEFSAVFILWRRGRPHPAAVFFLVYSATGAGDGAAGCQPPGQRQRGAARDPAPEGSTACVDSQFSSWNFPPSLSFGEGVGRISAAVFFLVYSATGAGDGAAGCQPPGQTDLLTSKHSILYDARISGGRSNNTSGEWWLVAATARPVETRHGRRSYANTNGSDVKVGAGRTARHRLRVRSGPTRPGVFPFAFLG